MNILNKKSYSKIKIFLVLFFVVYFIFDAIQVSAHSAYYLKLTYDEGAYNFQSEIVTDSEGLTDIPHIESSDKGGNFLAYIKSNIGKKGTPWTNSILGVTDGAYNIGSYLTSEDSMGIGDGNEKSLYYTFPPIHVSSGKWYIPNDSEDSEDFGDDVGDANSKDMDLAYRINDNLVQHFNILSENIINSQGYRPDARKYLMFLTHLANEAWNVSVGAKDSVTLTYDLSLLSSDGKGKTTIKIEHVNPKDKKYLKVKNPKLPDWAYLKISLSGTNGKTGESIYTDKQIKDEDNIDYYVAFLDKGYCEPGMNESYTVDIIGTDYEPQQARSKDYRTSCAIGERTKDDNWSSTDARDFEWFGWKSVILQADYLLSKNITAGNSEVLGDTDSGGGWLLHKIAEILTDIYTSILNILGLDSMEQIMLNRGRIGNRTYMGLFPKAWVPVVNFVNIILQLIVWSLLAFSLTRLLFKRSLATMNIGEKINLMDGLKNVITSAILMGIWPLLFTMLGRMNYFIVNMLGEISPYSDTFSMSIIGFNLISLFTAFYVLGITIFFNLSYIIRGITIAFLYALSPVFIYTISLGGKSSSYFNIFLKEMIGHIYIQSFHALMISFFSYLTKAGAGNSSGALGFNHYLVKWVLIFSFIPISNFIKNNILQMGDGVMSSMAHSLQKNAGVSRKYGKEEAKNMIGKALNGVGGTVGGGPGGSVGRAAEAVGRMTSSKAKLMGAVQKAGKTHEGSSEIEPNRGESGRLDSNKLSGTAKFLNNRANGVLSKTPFVGEKIKSAGTAMAATAADPNSSLFKASLRAAGSGAWQAGKFAKNMAMANMASGVWNDDGAALEFSRRAGADQAYMGINTAAGFYKGSIPKEISVDKANNIFEKSSNEKAKKLNGLVKPSGVALEDGAPSFEVSQVGNNMDPEKRTIMQDLQNSPDKELRQASKTVADFNSITQFTQNHPEEANREFGLRMENNSIVGFGLDNPDQRSQIASAIRAKSAVNKSANNIKSGSTLKDDKE